MFRKKQGIQKGDIIYLNDVPAVVTKVEPGTYTVTAETTGVKIKEPAVELFNPALRCRDCALIGRKDCDRAKSGTTYNALICWKFIQRI